MRRQPPRVMLKAACTAAFCLGTAPAFAANPSLNTDFGQMTAWLSHELAQGLAFNAGETFDPPHEVTGYRLQPDLSIGVGRMPLDKSTFPTFTSPDLQRMDPASIFPSGVLFPNLSTHLRIGLPGRMDASVRFDNMSTPSHYRISSKATGHGQSNSIGGGLRKHFFGGPDRPMLSLGGNYNHVYGKFSLNSRFNVDKPDIGYYADHEVNGDMSWNVSSFGINAILSQTFGGWTPFVGGGYNYATGSVSVRFSDVSSAFGSDPILGNSSEHPEQNAARVIGGVEADVPWMHFFTNAEVKALGEHATESWIVQIGAALPFDIGARPVSRRGKRARSAAAADDAEPAAGKISPRVSKAREVMPKFSAPASRDGDVKLIVIE